MLQSVRGSIIISTPDLFPDPPRKRGRYSDPGSRGKEVEVTSEQRLESLITRVGEKVGTRQVFFNITNYMSPHAPPPSAHIHMHTQSNRSLGDNLGSLADVVVSELSEFKDKILRTICKW